MSQTTICYGPNAILPADLIRKLYGLDESLSTRKLTLSEIQKLTGAPWKYIKKAVTDPTSIVHGKCPCRYCPYAILSAGLIRKLYGLDESFSTRKLTFVIFI